MKNLLVLTFLFLTSCGLSEGLKESDAAIAKFHVRLDHGNYSEIYANSTTAFQTTTTQDDLASLLNNVVTRLGQYQGHSRSSFNVKKSLATGTTYTIVAAVDYQHGRINETFVFRRTGDVFLLHGFNFNIPPDMLEIWNTNGETDI